MRAVFISYRRQDTEGQARALFQDLVARLGKDSVFMDVDSIGLGRDFRQVLQERLTSCDLMLVLIGKDWVDAADESGRRRLENPGDFVRLEIAAALKRSIPVTPLLLQGAAMPPAEALPEDLRDLAFRNGFELSHTRWDSDVQELFTRAGLERRSGAPADIRTADRAAEPQPARKASLVAIGAAAVALAAALGGLWYYTQGGSESVTPRSVDDLSPPQAAIRPAFEEGQFHVVVASPRSESEARRRRDELRRKRYASEAYLTPSGAYAVTIGRGSSGEATTMKTTAIQAGDADDSAWLSQGKTWLTQVP